MERLDSNSDNFLLLNPDFTGFMLFEYVDDHEYKVECHAILPSVQVSEIFKGFLKEGFELTQKMDETIFSVWLYEPLNPWYELAYYSIKGYIDLLDPVSIVESSDYSVYRVVNPL